jgi:hypothetical protein
MILPLLGTLGKRAIKISFNFALIFMQDSGNYTSNSKEVEKMKLNLKALTVTFAIFWAGVVFIVGVANVVWPGYGRAFLLMMASIYPGYAASGSFGDVVVGSLYALVDGAILGFILGWLYNLMAGRFSG